MPGPDEEFWERVAGAGSRLLALDYDGTLAPFRVERMEARPAAGVVEALKNILASGSTLLAVVSGRPLAEVSELLGPISERVTVVGAHGWEWRRPGGPVFTHPLPEGAKEALAQAEAAAIRSGAQVLGGVEAAGRVERKAAGVAVHVRGLEGSAGRRWLESVAREWEKAGPAARLLDFHGGLELRAPGWDKGRALLALSEENKAEVTVYVGDDATDEDAFRSLADIGIGIRVGEWPESAARYALAGVGAVADFLRRWQQAAGPGPGRKGA